jgi:MoxR-like ATPase
MTQGGTDRGKAGVDRRDILDSIVDYLSPYLHGKTKPLRLSLICFFSRGHLLIEDLPGLGKTTLAIAIARVLGLRFGRVQCTSDLLPSDITGLSIYDKNTGNFEFHPGPIFNNLVLVDEINRTTPKTQSALLEGMQEKQVTIEGKTYPLERPFFVIATQNSSEQFGTFSLPDSQLDRFMLKISIGYPPRDAERQILKGGGSRDAINMIEPILTAHEASRMSTDIKDRVHASEKVLDYVLDITRIIRTSAHFAVGLSTRGALALTASAKTNAYFHGRDYVIPEDVKELAEYVIPHRVLFREEYDEMEKKEIIRSLIEEVPVLLS